MSILFDEHIERRATGSIKWNLYEADVLPMWVADMDFRVAEPIRKALHDAVEHGIFGYQFDSPPLREVIVQRMQQRYQWTITPQQILFIPNLVSALNFVCMAFAEPGDEVLTLTPVYPPFLNAPTNSGRVLETVDLIEQRDGAILDYVIDFQAFEAAITPRTKVFMLCNPHNPMGKAWSRADLEQLAAICLRHGIVIVADEIHCDLLLDDGLVHTPMASLGEAVAAQTVTLMSPSKTFNLPTLGLAYVIAQNPDLLQRFQKATDWFVPHPGTMGYAAAYAAYSEGQAWVDGLLPYLRANRDFMVNYLQTHLPQLAFTRPQATYLGWIDWRGIALPGTPYQFCLEKARVAFNDGAAFGTAGEGHTRINFGTTRERLTEGLARIRAVVEDL
jgi:cystathionine beta-lyase